MRPFNITSRWGGAVLTAVLAVAGLHAPAAHAVAAADTVAPTITDIGLAAGTAVNGTVTLQPIVSDDVAVTRVELVTSGEWATRSRTAPFTLTWDSRQFRNTDVYLKLTAYDAAGNATTSDVVIVYADNDAPWLVFPWISVGASSQHPEMSFTGVTPIDFAKHGLPADTAGIELSIGSTVIGTATTAPWIINWDTSAYNGPTVLTVRGWDHFGNTMTLRGTVWADHTGPTITPEIYSPDFVGADGPIRVQATDGAGVRKTELLVNGTVVATDRTPGRYRTFTWPKGIPNGPATMTLRAEDSIGNISEHTRTVTVDNDKPVVTLTPANGALVRGRALPAAITAYKDATGISQFEAGIDGHTAYTHQAPWRVALDTTSYRDGRHTLTFRIVDKAGNQTFVTRTVTVDNTAPAIRYLQAPKNKTKVTKTFKINTEATDSYGIARVQLLVNGKAVATDTKTAYSFTVNPKKYGKKFTVQLRAYDKAGNVKYTTKRTYRR
jgi:Bacterial Ig domain/Bacterial Ig-like domain